ncbi:cell division protein DivIC [Marininema mesophilum]|uniref:Cell division protein DivIC n=1 Tax=Marininema mesophilum TaxID=1048340 RepID=A0A1H2X2X8_9BACL|nr:septum formation initiator family protein [Marininema mesophilum]SDW86629.1 cell division protein DivIC [Marininema mesophilum]
MLDRGSKVVSIRSTRPSQPEREEITGRRPPLPRGVRRRRRLWLVVMVAVFLWSGTQLWIESSRITEGEEVLAAKVKERDALEKKKDRLKEEMGLLKDKGYLEGLARKMGYKMPGE